MNKLHALVAVPAFGLVSAAQAAVPTEVSTALTDAATDVGTMAGLLLLVAVAAVGIFLGIKYVRKIPKVG